METRTINQTPPSASLSPNEEIKRKEDATHIAAYEVGPRVYKLTGIKTDPVRFFVLGCHGNGKQSQINTAALMNQIAQELETAGEPAPSYILFLGDNIYDYGVSSPFDPAFNNCFYNIYYDDNLSAINKLPCWLLLGNHDFNMHSKAFLGRFGAGEAVAMNQVGHTYTHHNANTVAAIEKNAAIFKNKELSPEMLWRWNMPYLFYSILAGNTQTFCLDSNNFLADYLDYLNGNVDAEGKNIKTGHINQAAWFFAEYAAAKDAGKYSLDVFSNSSRNPKKIYLKDTAEGLQYEVVGLDGSLVKNILPWGTFPPSFPRKLADIIHSRKETLPIILEQTTKAGHTSAAREIFIAQHHPLFVSGKRALPEGYDWKHYLNEMQLNDLNAKLKSKNHTFIETKSYNGLLAAVFETEGIDPDLVFAAHEHFQSYYNNTELRQLTSGGGGGDLQKRLSYLGHPYVSMFQKHNGFTMVTCDPKHPGKFTLDTYTTEGLHLRFHEDSHQPEMHENDDPEVEMLRNCVIRACDYYLTLLKNEEQQKAAAEKNIKSKSAENTGMVSSVFRMFSGTYNTVYNAASALLDHLYPNSNSEIENSTVQDIQAYFCQLDLSDHQTVITALFKLTRQLPYRLIENDYTFYSILQRIVKNQSGQELETLFMKAGLQDFVVNENNAVSALKM